MSSGQEIQPFSLPERVVHQLVVRSFIEDSTGLLSGKMGISVAFFHFARFSRNPVYGEIAECLVDDVWNTIGATSSLAFSDGLTGIGWGVEYLIQHGFVSGDSNEVCAELDSRIFRRQHEEDLDSNLEDKKARFDKKGDEDIKLYTLARRKSANMDIYSFIPSEIHLSDHALPQTPLGLTNGLAGWLLLQMRAEASLTLQTSSV